MRSNAFRRSRSRPNWSDSTSCEAEARVPPRTSLLSRFEPPRHSPSMSVQDLATWTAVIGTWVLVVGTLAFAYWQTRLTRRINSATTILDLRGKFEAPAMIAARRLLATELLAEDAAKEIE